MYWYRLQIKWDYKKKLLGIAGMRLEAGAETRLLKIVVTLCSTCTFTVTTEAAGSTTVQSLMQTEGPSGTQSDMKGRIAGR
jgi:hypothetical protein